MTTLDSGEIHAVLINTFQVKPGRAEELLALLTQATEDTVHKIPGFISANLHVSLDGKKVVNYAQWRSKSDFDRAMHNPQFQKHMEKVRELVEGFEPVLYQLRYTHEEGEA